MEQFLQVMIPDAAPKTPIATLVFMDLETTGLPTFVGKKNVHITEMSLVAVDRTNFEDEDTSLRVLNKLSVCIQPRTKISYGAMKVTGLCNDILQFQQTFDESIPKLLEVFFCRLREPICLLAHNGKSYDFPILQAELKRLGYSFPENILCADTLEAFRTMGLVSPNHSLNVELNAANGEVEEMTDEVIDRLLTEDLDIFQKIVTPGELTLIKNENYSIKNEFETSECCNTCIKNSDHCLESILVVLEKGCIEAGYGEKTPEKHISRMPQNIQCHIQERGSKITPHHLGQPKYDYMFSKKGNLKRRLFEDEIESNGSKNTNTSDLLRSPSKRVFPSHTPRRVQYSLDKLYIHYFGEQPHDHHHAESDCINLSKICRNVSRSFLPWLDKNNKSFCFINPLW